MVSECERAGNSRPFGIFNALSRPRPGPPLVLWHSVSLMSALNAVTRRKTTEAVMTEHAVMEPAATAVAEPEDQNLVAADDEALVAGELLVEEVSIDGMCGVY
jgi:mycofactocin precursor